MSHKPLVPEAKEKLDELKTEYANEIGIAYSNNDKGDRPSKLNGHIGGPVGGLMTKKMVEAFENKLSHR
ncbi:alpha/beta-type small acid-soluble spore protein [Clostridium hydrogenum]|uniref:alpha/beta-type small acid-soluble spore protein n=1 Tax=Clostridium hydrogenum TaxID=2855764 RepID=UPI001F1D3CF6|nr:alpha/beta-type small acid-soluble spore protein [Clostridium hydrogenum]